MNYSLEKADKALFAVYQTMYSRADVEMWYDWGRRLEDTDWTDNCYFLMADGVKAGGVILGSEGIIYPFTMPPFEDKVRFWRELLKLAGPERHTVHGVTEEHVRALQTMGFVVKHTKQVMVRPADKLDFALPSGFTCRKADPEKDVDAAADVLRRGYLGSIAAEIDGDTTPEDAYKTAEYMLTAYTERNGSYIITSDETGENAAVCLAGVFECVLNFTEIGEICVAPEYRGQGLAKYLIARTVSEALGGSPFVKLLVHKGNYSENLYHELGFITGPAFTDMERFKPRVQQVSQ